MCMSEGTDGVKAKGKRQKARANYFLPFSFCFLLFTLFSGGCAQKQRVVELYVDAVMLRELDEKDKAIEKLDLAVRSNENFSLAYSLLGEIYQEIKDYEKSAASYEKAPALNPWAFKDYFNLGRAYKTLKKFAQAVRAYGRACELKPNHLEAHINAAKSHYEMKDYNSALAYGKRAEQIDQNVGEIQKLLGDIYKLQKDYDQSVAAYKRSLEIDSNDPEVMISLAVAYLRTNRNEPAKELLTSVIQIQPDNNAAHQYLGYYYLRLYSQTIAAYKRELKIDSDNTELLISLKEDVDKAVDKAMESYRRAIEINDKDWQAYRGLGVAYMLMGINNKDETLKAKAVQQWHISLDIKPDQPTRERLLKLVRKYSPR